MNPVQRWLFEELATTVLPLDVSVEVWDQGSALCMVMRRLVRYNILSHTFWSTDTYTRDEVKEVLKEMLGEI